MTVDTEVSSKSYFGTGATVFPTTFPFDEDAHLTVKLIVTATGAETIQTLGVDYTVTGAGDPTGNVIFGVAPPVTLTILIERDVPVTQETSFRSQGSFSPAVHEDAMDRIVQQVQMLLRRVATLENAADETTVALAGNGLTKSVDTLHVGAGDGIQANADSIEVLYGAAADLANVTRAAEAAGTLDTAARADHKHDVDIAAPPAGAVVVGGVAAAGAGPALAASNHIHEVLTAAPVDIDRSAAVTGASGRFSDASHKHDITVAAPVSIGSANAVGAGPGLATSNHVHDHGAQTVATHHAVATTAANGFMAATDKLKLDAETVTTATVQTTNATVTAIATVTPTDETIEFIEATIIGLQDTGATGAGYRITGTFRRDGGTTVQVGTTTADATNEDTASWAVDFTVSTPVISIRVTGAGATNINWRAMVRRFIHP